MPRKIGGDRSADAEADRKDGPNDTRSCQVVENYERVREERPGARPAAARRIAAIVERNDVTMWKERVQGEGHRFGVPGVPAKAQQRRRAIVRLCLGRDSHTGEPFAVGRPDLETLGLGRCRKADADRSGERRRKEKPGLGEIDSRYDQILL